MVRVRACVCFIDRKHSRVVASSTVALVQTAMYLNSYGNCLTGFCDPLSPPFRYHTSVWFEKMPSAC